MTKEEFEALQTGWNEMKAKLAQRDEEIKKYGEASAETEATIKKLNDRIDELETKANRPAAAVQEKARAFDPEAPEVKAFANLLRKGVVAPEEAKLLSTDSDPDGGYLVPTQMANQIISKLIEVSPVRELAEVMPLSLGDTLEIPAEDETEFGGGWVSERGERGETQSGKIRMKKLVAHEMYANPFVTQKLLDDSAFNVESWLSGRVAIALAKVEGSAFINGDGVNKPEGILVSADVAAVAGGHASELTADGIKDLVYAVPEFYAKNGTFLLRRATLGIIRKLKDGQGNYLWQPGLQAGQPGTIEGQRYREAVDMPTVATNAFPIVFGDFRAAYKIVDRQGIRVTRDPFSNKPFVEFYTTKRTGGLVVLGEALRKLKIATSV